MSRRLAGRAMMFLGFALLTGYGSALAQNSFSDDIRLMPPPTRNEPSQPNQQSEKADPVPPGAPAPSPVEDPGSAKAASSESEDFGVKPTTELHSGPMHGPTPTLIPGGLVITTEALAALYNESAGAFVVFDVLGGPEGLPNAQNAVPASNAGSFSDQTQREFGGYLNELTGGNRDVPLVFYCLNVYCWMSYNAALRAINLGYTRVLWYRGGIEAWQQADLPTYSRQF